MNKYDICQFSILQDIPVHVVDMTESPVKINFRLNVSAQVDSNFLCLLALIIHELHLEPGGNGI